MGRMMSWSTRDAYQEDDKDFLESGRDDSFLLLLLVGSGVHRWGEQLDKERRSERRRLSVCLFGCILF